MESFFERIPASKNIFPDKMHFGVLLASFVFRSAEILLTPPTHAIMFVLPTPPKVTNQAKNLTPNPFREKKTLHNVSRNSLDDRLA